MSCPVVDGAMLWSVREATHSPCSSDAGSARAGVVQGVGFRPFVYRLAREHGLGGYVLNDGDGVVIEVEGAELDAFADELVSRAPSLASRRLGDGRAGRAARRDRLPDRRERRLGPRRADPARRRHLRRLPPRALRPGRPPLPLPVHQLHAVRARASRSSAPSPTTVRTRRWPASRCAPSAAASTRTPRPPLPRRADRVPRVRAAALDAARGGGRGARRRRDPRGQGPRRLPPGLRRGGRGRGLAAAREKAPRGEALRGDVGPARPPRPRDQGGAEAAPVAGAPDRPAPPRAGRARRRVGRARHRRGSA